MRIPILILAAAADRVVSLRAIEAVAGGLRAGAQAMIVGSDHEMMMERDSIRAQFWAAFDAFIPGTGG
ncbi:MAG: hypothetical protein WDN31_17115 [Hyphomicrobium sp.]